MKMIIRAIVILAVLALATSLFAQAPSNRAQGQANRAPMIRIAKALNLTQPQIRQLREIVKAYRTDVKSIAQSNSTKQEKAARIKSLREKASQDIFAVLTPEQKTKAQQMNVTKLLLAPRQVAKLTLVLARLDLTAAQKTSIQAMVRDHSTKAKSVRADASLSEDSKKQKLTELRKGLMHEIRAQLTPEQLTRFNRLMKLGGARANVKEAA